MMKYNSKIFARSICAVMAGVMMVGGLTGCGNDDAEMAGECALKNKMGIRQR